jgi:hypothetical protein
VGPERKRIPLAEVLDEPYSQLTLTPLSGVAVQARQSTSSYVTWRAGMAERHKIIRGRTVSKGSYR